MLYNLLPPVKSNILLSLFCSYTVILSVRVSAKFSTCTAVSVNGTLVEDKMRILKGECAHFSFNKCHNYIHDGVSAKFSTNSHETDNSVRYNFPLSIPAPVDPGRSLLFSAVLLHCNPSQQQVFGHNDIWYLAECSIVDTE
jgi:hypothetical protein